MTVNGAVLYQGPSVLDGQPIVVILTGLATGSHNRKTGKMIQSWILRADVSPAEAVKSGQDSSICGDCKHRRNQGGACYVVVEQGPLQVYKAWQRGSYADWTKAMPAGALSGKRVRFGSYGDPAAVPYAVWRRVREQRIAGWTGYTHQWRRPEAARLRNFVMASVDTQAEAAEANRLGWRYFRVSTRGETATKTEAYCPASEEMGKRTTCEKCCLCQGQAREARDIVIAPHGYLASRLRRLPTVATT
jgi:hypothetical protein